MKKMAGKLLVIGLFVGLLGCSLFTDSSTTDFSFKTQAANVTPSFKNDMKMKSLVLNDMLGWDAGSPIFNIYDILNDSGERSGYFNIYEFMAWVDTIYKDAIRNDFITEQTIVTPVDLGFGAQTYNQKYYYVPDANSTDMNKTWCFLKNSTNIHSMVMSSLNSNSGLNKSIIQGYYDETSKNLKLSMFSANHVVEANTRWEVMKAAIEGNPETHVFTLQIIYTGFVNDGTISYIDHIIGYGKSQGSTDDYFLLKFKFSDNKEKYYKFVAGMNKEALITMSSNETGYTNINSTIDPSGYATNLPAYFSGPGVDYPSNYNAFVNMDMSLTYQ